MNRTIGSSPGRTPGNNKPWVPDILAGVALALVASGLSILLWKHFEGLLIDRSSNDLWFGADIPRVFENLTSRWSDHYRTAVHPLFSLLVALPTIAVIKVFGLSPIQAVSVSMGMVAAAVTGCLYAVLRLIAPRLDASVYTALFLSSACFMFWFSVPETYAWGAFSILAAVLVTTVVPFGKLPAIVVFTSALTLGFTVTNWFAGLVAAFLSQPRRNAIRLSVFAFALVAFLTPIQNVLFPSAGRFLNVNEEPRYVSMKNARSPGSTLATYFVNSVVAPEPALVPLAKIDSRDRVRLSSQTAEVGSGGPAGIVAVAGWCGLLGLGVWGMARRTVSSRLSIAVGLILFEQLALHFFYGGDGPFLYAAHYVPLLIIVAGFASVTPARWIALALAALVTVAGGINNFAMFNAGQTLIRSRLTASDEVRHAMLVRPNDPWPRGQGHVLLAVPGTSEHAKSYLEPGGSFSPAAGSFGLSIWVVDDDGGLLTTSDALPLEDITQEFRQGKEAVLSLVTETPFYRATWTHVSANHWRLELAPKGVRGHQLSVAVRSVGPAGGPITSLSSQDGRLWINGRWVLDGKPPLDVTYLGEEGSEGWTHVAQRATALHTLDGWGHARLSVDPKEGLLLDIHDTREISPSESLPAFSRVRSGLQLDVPDSAFVNALEAQVAHIMMGLVGRETRPGDPISYPLAWQRDGAHVVVALLQAGRDDVARELITMFAEVDFFGGFGSEADAPGLSLWAMGAVADAVRDPAFDTEMWPHAVRKAELIMELLTAKGEIRKPFVGRVTPARANHPDINLVAKAADQGLITGRMDWHFPILYVNAVSYRGLMDAARLAEREGERGYAARWRGAAEGLRRAWNLALVPPEQDNPRTLMSGIWPTFVATDDARFSAALNRAWEAERMPNGGFRSRPLWTYFELAQAHQWLYLAKPERAWLTLKWFWEASPAPGLYTLWEGNGGDSFGGWLDIRGWVNSPTITPHYWAAAEMLSLQLAMLVYYDPRPEVDSLVIGAGVPRSWLEHPLRVAGVVTPVGRVDWEWNGDTVTVHLNREPVNVRLGPEFPSNARLQVSFSSLASSAEH